MSDARNCDRQGCKKAAKYRLVIDLRAYPSHPPATAEFPLCVCEDHKHVQLSDLVDENFWRAICLQFRLVGKMEPKQQYSAIRFVPLKDDSQ